MKGLSSIHYSIELQKQYACKKRCNACQTHESLILHSQVEHIQTLLSIVKCKYFLAICQRRNILYQEINRGVILHFVLRRRKTFSFDV